MAGRYARIDVEFFHKSTANKLLDELGPWGPLVFIALILRAKDGTPPGTFSYPNDPIGWERLGLADHDVPFTLDEFFALTGRLKQTSRRRNGRVWNAYLTRYGLWQKDARRFEEAVRKARKRGETAADTERTAHGTDSGHDRGPTSTSTSTPLTPRQKGTNPRTKGTSPRQTAASTNGLVCPHCGAHPANHSELEDHLELFHTPAATVTPNDGIPF